MNKKEALRLAMPITAQLVDSHRLIFGELNAIKATENGHSIEWRKTRKAHADEKRKGG